MHDGMSLKNSGRVSAHPERRLLNDIVTHEGGFCMDQERLSRIALFGLVMFFLLVRFYFTLTLRRKGGKSPRDRNAIAREGKVNFVVRRFIIAPALSVFCFLYYANPLWMRSFSIPLPQLGIWIVAIVGLCGIVFLIWVHVCLGKEWSANLQLRKDHLLIQSGPYSRIRHPMYTALFTFYLSAGIVSSNYVILILLALAVVSIAIRIPKEEEMLIGEFGDEYRKYMKNTGSLFPKLGKGDRE
jgi:protein-S-isoprenylcysteine O-methyltransferase Ste14